MKYLFSILLLLVVLCKPAGAQSFEIQQLLLNYEKLQQLKNILSDMKKGYDILKTGYNTVKDISEGNFSIHQVFLDALLQVSPFVKKYRKVGEIISNQISITSEYKAAYNRFKRDPNLSAGYLKHISDVYSNLFNLSIKNLDRLTNIVTASKLRMSDDERLEAIDAVHNDVQEELVFLRDFNNSITVYNVQQAREKNDVNTLNLIYGLTK